MAITCASDWRGTSGSGGKWANHESNLSADEMIALATTIIDLGEMNNLPTTAAQCWKDLATSLKTGSVEITKGIHQRESKVHFDVTGSVGANGTYHVFVKAGDSTPVTSSPLLWGPPNLKGKTYTRNLFKYAVSGLSCKVGGTMKLYPAIYVTLSDVEKPLGRARGQSFSTGNSKATPTLAEQLLM
jgi:hypothetical protein